MPRRVALVVGVGQYQDLSSIPNAIHDAERMAHVLKHIAGFDDVRLLIDPEALPLAEASEYLFADKALDDLVLLYFSGHGIKDERGQLHLAVGKTHKHANGELVRATAVSCRHIHDTMTASRSRRQVVILDCCFSGAFADGLQPKDGGHIDLSTQLGGEGRVILTSSASTQYSFNGSESGLSTYTQNIVHGIESGDADLNHDGLITADELHEYAKARVQSTQPAMSPQILPNRQGYSIVISTAQTSDPRRTYAGKVREVASKSGTIEPVAEQVLALHRGQLGLTTEEARTIEDAELGPRRNLIKARAVLRKAIYEARVRKGIASDRSLLNELRVALGLTEADFHEISSEALSAQRKHVVGWRYWPARIAFAVTILAVATFITSMVVFSGKKIPQDDTSLDSAFTANNETPIVTQDLPSVPSPDASTPPPDAQEPPAIRRHSSSPTVPSKPATQPAPVDLPAKNGGFVDLPKLALRGDAPRGTSVGDAIGGGTGHMVQGPGGFVASIEMASNSRPRSLTDAVREADMYTPKNLKEIRLSDGWAITFDNEGGMGKNYFVNVRRSIDGKPIWCETTSSSPEQQRTVLSFCRSIKK